MFAGEDKYWYNLRTGKVERGFESPAIDRVGPFDTEEEAIALANDTPYGLAAYLQTGSDERVDEAYADAVARVDALTAAVAYETKLASDPAAARASRRSPPT